MNKTSTNIDTDTNTEKRKASGVLQNIKGILTSDRTGAMVLLAIAVIALSITTGDTFLSFANLRNLARFSSFYVIVGIACMFVFMAGEFDLSVGSIMGLAGIVGAIMAKADYNLAFILITGIAIGAAVGVLNGYLVGYWGLAAFVTTLGVQKAVRGLVTVITSGYAVTNLKKSFLFMGGGSVLNIPMPVWIAVAVCLITWFIINRTVFGRHLAATGNNKQAAIVCGINVKRIKLLAFTYAGMLAALAGMVLTARIQSGQTSTGEGFELDAIAGAIIGGASLGGGSGSVVGTVCGILVIYTIKNGMTLLSVNAYWQNVVQGSIIVLAVFIDVLRKRSRK